ncbi:hypothetical protein BCR41DRAFT_386341 [Lobosporangium transversale]|uniref:Tetraspanin family-domain-containing protein n=1 Tax=Lobosporangium transversale TaxID=64571 RepID=A0A1Y2GNM1_9FUNG|nr:hypothetical protein BCR41DRAFT_386341 [Lobosporangium transversale]ORZ16783.1 hypothetical protein BCR41DRAFT_386341 [Lobosporangium transversale]|eukprot:XP_021881718.1 hypothetical protein BCR41DRAFT_386341 [Lobosporangium transversale]
MIPALVLLTQILQTQKQNIKAMHPHDIILIPTLSIGVDLMSIGVVLVSIMGLCGIAKGCTRLMNLYFVLVLCFIAIQVGHATISFMSGSPWVEETLENSWDKAYDMDKGTIWDLQREFHCQGFRTQEDRAVRMMLQESDSHLSPCLEILQRHFGHRLRGLSLYILCIRLIQFTGVFLLSILFKYLTVLEQTEENEQSQQTDEESRFFKNEKQFEDEGSGVSLMAEVNTDGGLPQYTAEDTYDGQYGYHDLPEYVEDEYEPTVYIL